MFDIMIICEIFWFVSACFLFSQPLLATPTHSRTPCVSSIPGQCRVSPILALLSFQNRSHQALSICEYSKTAHVEDVEIWVAPVQNRVAKERQKGGGVAKKVWSSMGWLNQLGLLTAVADHCRSPLTICLPIIDFGPDGKLISGSVLAHTCILLCYAMIV